MNDPEFEKNLRETLRPAAPSANLAARIRRDLLAPDVPPGTPAAGRLPRQATPGFFRRFLRDFGWACAGATAALVALAVLHAKPAAQHQDMLAANTTAASATTDAAAFEHDETTHELVSSENSEQVIETEEGPAREVRYSYVERHAWSNPQTGARVVLEVPREDVYLVPVSLQ